MQDQNIRVLDSNFPETKINARGERVKITGPSSEVSLVKEVIEGMIEVAQRKAKVTEDDVNTLIALRSGELQAKERKLHPAHTGDGELILYTHKGEAILAKTPAKNELLNHLLPTTLFLPLDQPVPEKLILQ